MSGAGPVVLLTDFGLKDHYVGVMKGVLSGLAPRAAVVDLCHEIPPQDIPAAAFYLAASARYFPKKSLFVAVVDPGVGSSRKILWAEAAGRQFLVPDNGILSRLEDPISECRVLKKENLGLSEVSWTFHGRDIFAPAAAALANGTPPRRLGPRTRQWVRLPLPAPVLKAGRALGEILLIDRFGNATTNLGPQDALGRATVFFKGRPIGPVRRHYGEVEAGKPLALVGSSKLIELAVSNGNFAARFKARKGDPVECR